jgi:hypothetical protein
MAAQTIFYPDMEEEAQSAEEQKNKVVSSLKDFNATGDGCHRTWVSLRTLVLS